MINILKAKGTKKQKIVLPRHRIFTEKNISFARSAGEKRNYVSLTFDDGPNRRYTPKILDILKEFDIKATFFIVGKNAKKNPFILRRILDEGHDIGNHTYSHPVSPVIKSGLIEKEIKITEKIIKNIAGCKPYLFRPTWGPWDMNSRKMLETTERLGYLPVRWSISSMDWLGIKKVIKYKVLCRRIRHGDIFLFHDGIERSPVSKRESTVESLPKILHTLKSRSIFPLRLSRLLQVLEFPLFSF